MDEVGFRHSKSQRTENRTFLSAEVQPSGLACTGRSDGNVQTNLYWPQCGSGARAPPCSGAVCGAFHSPCDTWMGALQAWRGGADPAGLRGLQTSRGFYQGLMLNFVMPYPGNQILSWDVYCVIPAQNWFWSRDTCTQMQNLDTSSYRWI